MLKREPEELEDYRSIHIRTIVDGFCNAFNDRDTRRRCKYFVPDPHVPKECKYYGYLECYCTGGIDVNKAQV